MRFYVSSVLTCCLLGLKSPSLTHLSSSILSKHTQEFCQVFPTAPICLTIYPPALPSPTTAGTMPSFDLLGMFFSWHVALLLFILLYYNYLHFCSSAPLDEMCMRLLRAGIDFLYQRQCLAHSRSENTQWLKWQLKWAEWVTTLWCLLHGIPLNPSTSKETEKLLWNLWPLVLSLQWSTLNKIEGISHRQPDQIHPSINKYEKSKLPRDKTCQPHTVSNSIRSLWSMHLLYFFPS